MKYCLAVDIGASSGRHIVGWQENGVIKTEEVYRFKNGVKKQDGHLIWEIEELFFHVKEGIKRALSLYPALKTVAIDTWGVDYVLLNGDTPIMPCISYRDNRTEAVIDEVHEKFPYEKLFARTGIPVLTFNTIYQLYDDKKSGKLQNATDFLMMPAYLTYRLTGKKVHEYTNATTTALLNAKTGEFDEEIISALGLPQKIFHTPVQPGTKVGNFLPEIAKEVGGQLDVLVCASHDTGSAVEGIPVEGDNPYISSGTWSLLGLKVKDAICDEASRKAGYSNEGGVGYFRYQKNIMGMWIVNNLKAELCPQTSFDEIERQARESTFEGIVDVTDNRFLAPESMKGAFDGCFENPPKTVGDYFKCAFVSLAHGYKQALEELSANTGKKFEKLYIVGGGAKNQCLNELTECICNVKVIALPIEATAIGNLKIQLEANNE